MGRGQVSFAELATANGTRLPVDNLDSVLSRAKFLGCDDDRDPNGYRGTSEYAGERVAKGIVGHRDRDWGDITTDSQGGVCDLRLSDEGDLVVLFARPRLEVEKKRFGREETVISGRSYFELYRGKSISAAVEAGKEALRAAAESLENGRISTWCNIDKRSVTGTLVKIAKDRREPDEGELLAELGLVE